MLNRKTTLILACLVAAVLAAAPTVFAADHHVYPNDSIQDAIDAASDGDTIYVHEGTYNECLLIDGVDVSLIAVGNVMIDPLGACGGHDDAVGIYGAAVTFDGFTVDATGVTGGIYARSMAMDGEGPVNAVISNNFVFGYGKNGITVNGSGATAEILNNSCQGRGPVGLGDWAQNGIQFGWGAMGVARGNTTSDHCYTGPGWTAAGILLFDVYAVDVKTSQNMFRDNQRNLLLLTQQACPHQFGGVYEAWGLCSWD